MINFSTVLTFDAPEIDRDIYPEPPHDAITDEEIRDYIVITLVSELNAKIQKQYPNRCIRMRVTTFT